MTTSRTARPRHYAMTAPTFFAVEYAINPWMDTSTVVDTHVALNQWETLRQTYKELGHTVELVEPIAGLPDMVYAANGGLVVNGKAVVARFAYPQRAGESAAYAEWMTRHGYHPAETRHVNEGQGDLLVVGSIVLAGYGFRTERQAHAEIANAVGMPVVSLELVDPRFYHLDTALAVLDDTTVAYYPPAFSGEARTTLLELFPDAIEVAPALPSNCARPGSGPSVSTCPSFSRAADPSNAARWRYIRDDSGFCDCHRRRDRRR
jgi:N-dimethylarginine dimethylaminohydrolase